METFSELGTAGAIARLYEGSGYTPCTNPFFECSEGYVTSASVTLLEGIDFDLTFFPFKHLGYKAVVAPTGELFAVISKPRVLKAVIGVSSKLDFAEVSQIWEGIVQAAKDFGYAELGLELQPSLTGLSITVSATGFETREDAAQRTGARSMDLICLSNNAGAAFLGSQVLARCKDLDEAARKKKLEQYRQLVGAYLRPELSPAVLQALGESGIHPSFGYFCRRPLGEVVKQLCTDSGLGAKIYVDKLPLAGGSIDAAKEMNLDPLQAALRGGDDNCLLFTIPIADHEKFRHDFQSWDIIGHLAQSEVGAVVVSPDGLEHEISPIQVNSATEV